MAKTTKTGAKEKRKKTTKKKTAVKAAASDQPKKVKVASSGPRRKLLPRTIFAQHGELCQWKVVDATGLPLGRLSSYIAQVLMGKDKPSYTRHADTGDFVIVINCEKVVLTGNKWADKQYHYHTNYPGGLKTFTATELKDKHPERLVEWAVWGMLPKYKGHMSRRWHKKLHVFAGAEHPHAAQKPQALKLPNLGNYERA